MKPNPNSVMMDWFEQQTHRMYITSVTIAEITYGLHILPTGNRKHDLEDMFQKTLDQAFQYSILSFDEDAAKRYRILMGKRKMLGRPMSILDGQIAAIAQCHNLPIATRNIADFLDSGIALCNPFNESSPT